MLPGFANKTVTVERAPLVDMRGTQVRDWSHAEPHDEHGCYVDFSSTSTRWTDVRQGVTLRARLYAPPDADICEGDRICYRCRQYAIDGAPFLRESPTDALTHLECGLIDWSG